MKVVKSLLVYFLIIINDSSLYAQNNTEIKPEGVLYRAFIANIKLSGEDLQILKSTYAPQQMVNYQIYQSTSNIIAEHYISELDNVPQITISELNNSNFLSLGEANSGFFDLLIERVEEGPLSKAIDFDESYRKVTNQGECSSINRIWGDATKLVDQAIENKENTKNFNEYICYKEMIGKIDYIFSVGMLCDIASYIISENDKNDSEDKMDLEKVKVEIVTQVMNVVKQSLALLKVEGQAFFEFHHDIEKEVLEKLYQRLSQGIERKINFRFSLFEEEFGGFGKRKLLYLKKTAN